MNRRQKLILALIVVVAAVLVLATTMKISAEQLPAAIFWGIITTLYEPIGFLGAHPAVTLTIFFVGYFVMLSYLERQHRFEGVVKHLVVLVALGLTYFVCGFICFFLYLLYHPAILGGFRVV